MQLRELVGRAIAEIGERIAGRPVAREPGFPAPPVGEPRLEGGGYALSDEAAAMLSRPSPPTSRPEIPPPAPLEGSAGDRIARARGLVRS